MVVSGSYPSRLRIKDFCTNEVLYCQKDNCKIKVAFFCLCSHSRLNLYYTHLVWPAEEECWECWRWGCNRGDPRGQTRDPAPGEPPQNDHLYLFSGFMEMLAFTGPQVYRITGNLPGLKQLPRIPREFTTYRTWLPKKASGLSGCKGFPKNFAGSKWTDSTYQTPEDSSKGKVGVELLADAARPVHLLARHLLGHDGGVGDHLPGRWGEHRCRTRSRWTRAQPCLARSASRFPQPRCRSWINLCFFCTFIL